MKSFQNAKDKLNNYIDSIDVRWIVDKNLKCIYVSENIYQEYGYTPEEWMSQDVKRNKDYKDILHITQLAAKNVLKNKYYSFESQIKHRNGEFINVEITFRATMNKNKEVDGFYGKIRNINNKKELGKRFIVNEKSFKTTVPDITFICSIVAHDLINPYNIILGYTKILKDNYSTLSDANRINYIDKVHSYAKANFNLVNGLLKWAKLQSRGISIKNEVLNANDYLRKIVKPYLPLLDEKKINLVIDGKENEVFYADNKFFNIIIVNLFINAIKFSRKNGTITLQLKKEGNFTHIIVQDNGVGMSEEKLKEIFKLSCITSEIGTEGEQGTGMGLYICKKLIAYNKGTLNVSSQKDKGTKFMVSI